MIILLYPIVKQKKLDRSPCNCIPGSSRSARAAAVLKFQEMIHCPVTVPMKFRDGQHFFQVYPKSDRVQPCPLLDSLTVVTGGLRIFNSFDMFSNTTKALVSCFISPILPF